MLANRWIVPIALGWALCAPGQQASQPQVKLNVLNVCTPSPDEQKEIASALDHIPRQPIFSPDFEVDRGRSTLEQRPDFLKTSARAQFSSDPGTADWVRIRREFSVQAMFSTVQYSFSHDPKSMIETLTFHVRDPKDLLQLSIEDSASSVTAPSAMLGANTPASRIQLERFGKSSVVLARCSASDDKPAPDQSAYEPLFRSASAVAANYRSLLGARRTVLEELSRVSASEKPAPAKSAPGKAAQGK